LVLSLIIVVAAESFLQIATVESWRQILTPSVGSRIQNDSCLRSSTSSIWRYSGYSIVYGLTTQQPRIITRASLPREHCRGCLRMRLQRSNHCPQRRSTLRSHSTSSFFSSPICTTHLPIVVQTITESHNQSAPSTHAPKQCICCNCPNVKIEVNSHHSSHDSGPSRHL
jgi:hypothetical protein